MRIIDQRVAIADAMGWQLKHTSDDDSHKYVIVSPTGQEYVTVYQYRDMVYVGTVFLNQAAPDYDLLECVVGFLPNYLDLNVMRNVEVWLIAKHSRGMWARYESQMTQIAMRDQVRSIVHLTGTQKLEAVLKALCLWVPQPTNKEKKYA